MLVEDEPLISMMVEDMLVEIGCIVAGSARSVSGALALAERAPIDAALLDIHLIDGDSFELADRLYERGVPIVFSTGASLGEIPARYSVHPYVTKPFDLPDLEAGLRRALVRDAAEAGFIPRPDCSWFT